MCFINPNLDANTHLHSHPGSWALWGSHTVPPLPNHAQKDSQQWCVCPWDTICGHCPCTSSCSGSAPMAPKPASHPHPPAPRFSVQTRQCPHLREPWGYPAKAPAWEGVVGCDNLMGARGQRTLSKEPQQLCNITRTTSSIQLSFRNITTLWSWGR